MGAEDLALGAMAPAGLSLEAAALVHRRAQADHKAWRIMMARARTSYSIQLICCSSAISTRMTNDLNSHDKDPIKSIHFSSSNPLCHAFDPEAKDGHDLIVGVFSGDVYSMSLRQQLQDPGKKPVAYQHFINKDKDKDKDAMAGGAPSSRSTCVAWVPEREGIFVVSHADGNLYVYDKSKDGNTDWTFPTVKDQSQLMISHAKSSKGNPIARWHICQGAINGISFSPDGAYLATVGRDGYLRVFDFAKEQLIFGGKSYYGALLCCSWSADGKYLLSGGEDNLVQVWSMDERKIVAWGEGHNSWVILLLQLSLFSIMLPSFVETCIFLKQMILLFCRLAQLLLIRIGPHQILMKQEKMSCIALVLLVRYQEVYIRYKDMLIWSNNEIFCAAYILSLKSDDKLGSLTPDCFFGIWHWMRLLSLYAILQVDHRHLAVEAPLHTGTMHALQQVFFNLLHGCHMYPSFHPLLHTGYMWIPSLAWSSPVNQFLQ